MKCTLVNSYYIFIIAIFLMPNKSFSSESLVSIMHKALASDPRITIADYQYQISKNRKRQRLGDMLPNLRLTANFSDNQRNSRNLKSNYSGEKYNLVLRQNLYNKSAFSSYKRTGYEIKQRELEKKRIISEVVFDVAENYISILAAKDDLDLVQSELNAVQERLNKTQKLYNNQLTKVTDLYKVKIHIDKVKIQKIEKQNLIQSAKDQLSSMINESVGDITPLKNKVTFHKIEETTEFWLKKALTNNLEILAINQSIQAKSKRIDEAKGELHPTLGLEFVSQQSTIAYENAESPKTDTNYVGLVFNMPLYSGGITSAKVREAINNLSIARAEKKRVIQFIKRKIKEAYLNLQLSARQIKSLENRVILAKKSYKATESSLKYKIVTTDDLIQALHEKYQAERNLKDSRYKYLKSWLRLQYFAGELQPQTLASISNWFSDDLFWPN